jgi:membrane protein required for colicin V production
MIWIDYVIIGLVSITLITGFLRGFSLEFFSFVCWLLATVIGLNFSREFSVFLEAIITHPLLKLSASFLSLFLITLLVGLLIQGLLGESIKKPQLTFMDRLGGMIFGVLHGTVVVVILVMLAGLTGLPDDLWWKESKLLPSFQTCAEWSLNHIPSALAEFIHYR